MLKNIVITLAVIIAVLGVVISQQPDTYRVTRTTTIAAPPAVVFSHVNDLRKWDAWSPWAKLDPQAKTTYEGSPSGKGAIMRWAGNHNIGEGSMTIIESRPDQLIQFQLDFLKPFKGTATSEFAFEPQSGGGTAAHWSIYGVNNFMAKTINLVVNCDKMIGGQYEKGLAELKRLSETKK